MAHYYYFPFIKIDTTQGKGKIDIWKDTVDQDQRNTERAIRAKYQHGRHTLSLKKHPYPEDRPEIDVPGIAYKVRVETWNPPIKPEKIYAAQGEVEILCTLSKMRKSADAEPEWVYLPGGGQPLRQVKENDVLLVDGHCNQNSSKLSNVRAGGPTQVELEAKDLVAILMKQGLNDGTIVKLMGCYGGGGWTSDPNANESSIFAKRVAMYFGAYKDFTKVVVGGYSGEVVIRFLELAVGPEGYGAYPARTAVEHEGQKAYAKERIRYYNGKGELVKRPDKRR